MDDKDDVQDVEIMPTDIVFDCPNCNHNLVVDYRAAGLQVPCSQCGTIIQPCWKATASPKQPLCAP